MAYLIIPNDGSDLQLDAARLKSALVSRWPEIKFGGSKSDLEWKIPAEDDDIFGILHSDLKVISLFCFEKACTEFAAWYRAFVPIEHQLFLCHDQDAEMIIELRLGCTQVEILEEMIKRHD